MFASMQLCSLDIASIAHVRSLKGEALSPAFQQLRDGRSCRKGAAVPLESKSRHWDTF